MPKFGICVPNYNYASYLEETLRSALDQTVSDLEVVVRDNASTDRSVEVAEALDDPRVKVGINPCNVGFAGNLDRAMAMSQARFLLLLGSDDLLEPDLLETYERVVEASGAKPERTVFTAALHRVDSDGRQFGLCNVDRRVWHDAWRTPELDSPARGPVYRTTGPSLLHEALKRMTNPLSTITTVFPRVLWTAVGGYGGARSMNPDKWFHWRLLAQAEDVFWVDRPLGSWRWHDKNQTAQQDRSGALKYLVDDYQSTFELAPGILEVAGLTREEFADGFVEYDIARHGLATLAQGNGAKARRLLRFGAAAYPDHVRRNPKAWVLWALASAGPVGPWLASNAYRVYRKRDRRGLVDLD